jgi:hypothetical protein
MQGAIYAFEELAEDDLYRPPLSAQRALRCAGMLVSRAGWLGTPHDVRVALTWAGARDVVDLAEVKHLVDRMPLREMKLYPRWEDPSPYEVPQLLLESLAHARPLPIAFWQALRALDRHVLMMLSKNTRLLWRALDELAATSAHGREILASRVWHGLLGRCEMHLPVQVATRIGMRDFMDGRAIVLARSSGVRAARRSADLFDLRAGTGTGPIELGCAAAWSSKGATLLWQAHVSTAHGEFFSAASLLAVTASAVALYDMLWSQDPNVVVSIDGAVVREETWVIGDTDEVTLAR